MMNNKRNNRFYIKPPELPCVVYRNLTQLQQALIVAPIFLILLYFSSYSFLVQFLFSLIVIGIFIVKFKQDHNIRKVYLTNKTAEIILGFKRRKSVDLWDYYILIDRINFKSSIRDHYSYQVFLMPKKVVESALRDGNIYQMGWHVNHTDYVSEQSAKKKINLVGKLDAIPLSSRLFKPENVREYVEAIQMQSECPIHVVFASEQLRQDYDTGQYKA